MNEIRRQMRVVLRTYCVSAVHATSQAISIESQDVTAWFVTISAGA